MKKPEDLPSRREFTRKAGICLLATAIAVQLGPKLAAAHAKISKAEAKYQNHPRGDEKCAKCDNYLGHGQCKVVEGEVNPDGWCERYT